MNPIIEEVAELKPVNAVEPILKPFEDGINYFKTPYEIESFFITDKALNVDEVNYYKDTYKPLILSASTIYGVPYSFQSCLIYKESRFDHEAKSHVGALGIAQFTEDTYKFLVRALKIGKKRLELDNKENNLSSGIKILEKSEYESYVDFNVQTFKFMYVMWQNYLKFNNLKDLKLDSSKYKETIYNPEYAIGFSSMYLYYIKKRVQFNLNISMSDEEINHPEFFLSVAGAYNQGVRRLIRAVSNGGRVPRFNKWIKYQSRILETKNYIKDIRTCMVSETGLKEGYKVAEGKEIKQTQTN